MRRSASVTVTASLSEPSMSCSCSRVGVASGGDPSSGGRALRRRARRAAMAAAVAAAAPAANAASRVALCRLPPPRMPPDTGLSSRVGWRKVKFRGQPARIGGSDGPQRSAADVEAMALHVGLLALGAGREGLEARAVEAQVLGGLGQQAPHRELAVDPHEQALELDERAQGRVAAQLRVGLQASELLPGPARRHLEAIGGDAELAHEGQERVAVVLDLSGQARQELAEVGSLVLTGGAARELHAGG